MGSACSKHCLFPKSCVRTFPREECLPIKWIADTPTLCIASPFPCLLTPRNLSSDTVHHLYLPSTESAILCVRESVEVQLCWWDPVLSSKGCCSPWVLGLGQITGLFSCIFPLTHSDQGWFTEKPVFSFPYLLSDFWASLFSVFLISLLTANLL